MKKIGLVFLLSLAVLSMGIIGTGVAAELSGSLQIVGSTSVQPLADELAQSFMSKNKNVKIFVQGGGSGAGIKAAATGAADIGTSSRELKPDEAGLCQTVIAKDGIAVVVNKANRVKNLTTDQLRKIYAGEIVDWKMVGGAKGPIAVVNREEGSGTRGAFEELVLAPAKLTNTGKCLIQASTGAVQQTVKVTKQAIGYISLGSLDAKAVKDVTIDGVKCTEANILAGKYQLQRPFLMLTKTTATGLAKAFLDWVTGPEGQAIVTKEYIAVSPK